MTLTIQWANDKFIGSPFVSKLEISRVGVWRTRQEQSRDQRVTLHLVYAQVVCIWDAIGNSHYREICPVSATWQVLLPILSIVCNPIGTQRHDQDHIQSGGSAYSTCVPEHIILFCGRDTFNHLPVLPTTDRVVQFVVQNLSYKTYGELPRRRCAVKSEKRCLPIPTMTPLRKGQKPSF
jgi:hypothetical protein